MVWPCREQAVLDHAADQAVSFRLVRSITAYAPMQRMPMAKELLQRQIDATDRQIDRLGY